MLRLYEMFGSLGAAWNAPDSRLQAAELGEQTLTNLLRTRPTINLSTEYQKVIRAGATILTFVDSDYPPLLREMDEPPALLYMRGRLLPHDERALAVVGTRKATKYGQDAAYQLASEVAQQGITIISGLAQGIDAAAHKGALQAGGRTIAVLGSGVDVIYPQEHAALAERIIENGAILSEMPMGARPIAANFPRRNRILSGMTLGVLVVEAPEKSGALITAGLAAEQGREVFAVPANIFNMMGQGTNRLIQDGAKLVMCAADILDELHLTYNNIQMRAQITALVPDNPLEAAVMAHLTTDPLHIDELVRLSGLSTPEVSSTLTILEVKGVAQMVGHMQYCLIYAP